MINEVNVSGKKVSGKVAGVGLGSGFVRERLIEGKRILIDKKTIFISFLCSLTHKFMYNVAK